MSCDSAAKVRKYTRSVDLNTRDSIYDDILSGTGYRLPKVSSDKVTDIEKRETLIRIKNDWLSSECQLRKTSKEIQESTNCIATREISGRYSYRDMITGDEIEPEEYANRYKNYNCRKKLKKTQNLESCV